MEKLASPAQIGLIERLKVERECSGIPRVNLPAEGLPSRDASLLISALLKAPVLPGAPAPGSRPPREAAPLGFYVRGEKVYQVVEGRSGRRYAKVFVLEGNRGSWVYAKGAAFDFKGEERLSLEYAARFGKATGVCLICGRSLSDPASVERGIGPVCEGRVSGVRRSSSRRKADADLAAVIAAEEAIAEDARYDD